MMLNQTILLFSAQFLVPHRIVGPTLGLEFLQMPGIPAFPNDELIVKKVNLLK